MRLARSIRMALAREGVTQTWLAEQLGVKRATVNNYCLGKGMPSHKRIEVIADIFGMSVSELYALGEK